MAFTMMKQWLLVSNPAPRVQPTPSWKKGKGFALGVRGSLWVMGSVLPQTPAETWRRSLHLLSILICRVTRLNYIIFRSLSKDA